MKTKPFLNKALFFCTMIAAILFGCKKDEDTITPVNGDWAGKYTEFTTNNDDIAFEVNTGEISTITFFLYFSNSSLSFEKTFLFGTPFVDSKFKYESGNKIEPGGMVIINGTFTSEMECSGTIFYEETSIQYNAHGTYTFHAKYKESNEIIVSSISELRAGKTDGTIYHLSSEAILIFATENYNRNHKYIQDETGGILIDDYDGKITTRYNLYDGISGISGTLLDYKGMLEFIPVSDPGTPTSTNNLINPKPVTIHELNTNFEAYESQLIVVSNVSFSGADGIKVFQTGGNEANYYITDGTNVFTFRVHYEELNYVGEIIPSGNKNIVGVAIQYYEISEIFSRNRLDINSGN